MAGPAYCAKHPDVQTNLRCNRCEKLICPQCMVHSPVGVRCPDCAQVRRIPTYDVTRPVLARAIAAGVVLGIASGLAAGFISLLLPIFLLELAAIVAVGYLIGEGISVAANRKRGRSLKFVASGSTLIALTTISLFSPALFNLFGLLAGGAAFYVAINRF